MTKKNNTLSPDKTGYLSRRLFGRYIKPRLRTVLLAAVLMIIAAAATALNAWLLQPVMDEIFLEQNTQLLVILPAAILAVAIVKGLATYGQSVLMKIVGQRVTSTMQLDMYAHLLKADITTFSNESSGRLVSRFTNDIQVIRKNLTQVLVGLVKESLTLVALFGVMLYQSWQLTAITLLAFPLAIYPVLRLGKRMRRVSDKTQIELGHFTARLDDTFQGVRMVKACNNEEAEISKARQVINDILALYIKAAKTESAASPIMEGLAGVAIAAVVWYGGSQVLAGETTPGAFFSFIAALIMAYKPMKALAGINANWQEGLAAVQRLFGVLDLEPAVSDKPDAKVLVAQEADITFDGVTFHYTENIPALNGLTLQVPAGKRVALVGPSGGGKTTIMQMLLRFYDPRDGQITINSENIRDVTLASLRQHIALVNQEATLFDDTIRANIAYGKPEATEEQIIEAAKAAAAHEFILQQPEGYDTLVGQQGLRLSGGQRQRIAIARAMLRNAPILLLDEATSALDTVSEKQVQEALDTLMEGRTTLIIAHRLSTVMHADIIYVIEDGQAKESGTHAELLKQKGLYASLYHQQFEQQVA